MLRPGSFLRPARGQWPALTGRSAPTHRSAPNRRSAPTHRSALTRSPAPIHRPAPTTHRPRSPRRATLGFAAALVGLLAIPFAHAADKIPRLPSGRPDFSGIWQTTSAADFDLEPHAGRRDAPPSAGIVEGNEIPYLPAALEQKKKNFAARATHDPRLKCWTLGTPRGIYYPEPFQIFQRDRDLTLVFQFGHSVRTIHTNGTLHPESTDNEFWLGDSRGRWEGDTLVVDVKDFNGETWLDRAGNFHSEALHVVERWKFLDANTIEYAATLEDPNVYSRPWNISVILHRHREKNFQLIENYCYTLDYDQYYPMPSKQ